MTSNEALRELRLMNCDRRALAYETYLLLYDETETFRDDDVGLHLSYLMAAILEPSSPPGFVDWTMGTASDMNRRIIELLKEHRPATHPVWEFILLDP